MNQLKCHLRREEEGQPAEESAEVPPAQESEEEDKGQPAERNSEEEGDGQPAEVLQEAEEAVAEEPSRFSFAEVPAELRGKDKKRLAFLGSGKEAHEKMHLSLEGLQLVAPRHKPYCRGQIQS